jgi:sugar/nucleoside kinase (ribokinase family)
MGETMASNNFECLPGGKGANYCIASSRLGSKNAFICKVRNFKIIFESVFTIHRPLAILLF